jgi:hypothetical protein
MEILVKELCCCEGCLLDTQRICAHHVHQIHRIVESLASFALLATLMVVE